MRTPLGLALRRIAAQREDVVDAGVADLVEDVAQLLLRGADARQVSHGLEPVLVLERLDDLDGAVARRPAGAVGDRHVGRLERAQLAQGVLQVVLAVLGLGWEELEGEDRLGARGDDLVDAHDCAGL